MKKKTYWQKRSEDRLLDLLTDSDSVVLKLGRYYDKASKDIDKSIKSLYGQFMSENELDSKKALELIKGDEFRLWRMTMEEYLSQIKATQDKALLLELNTLAMRSRINRLEALQAEILAQSAIIASKEEEVIGSFLSDSIEDTYYKNVYDEYKDENPEVLDLMDRHKVGISRNQVKKVLELPWSGANYSQNIWINSYFIAKRAQAMVAKNIVAGRSIENLSRDFAKIYGKQYYSNAKRLIRTETAYVKGQADVLTYKKIKVEEYELLATLDNRTSSICQEKDGQHFPVDKIQVGINYPPFHPNCRTTTIKYREDYGDRTRIAKDKDGRNVKVPLGMKYEGWKKYISGKFDDLEGLYDRRNKYVVNNIINGTYGVEINNEKQEPHIEATAKKGKSYLFDDVNPQELFNNYAGTGIMELDRRGNKTNKEICKADRFIGINGSDGARTKVFKIHHSKKRTHISPCLEKGAKDEN